MKLKPSTLFTPWRFAMLQAAACVGWMVHLGNGRVWNNQMGQWPAGLAPWTGWLVLDFALLVLLFVSGLALLRRRPVKNDIAWLLLEMLVLGQLAAAVGAWDLLVGTFPHGIDHPAFMFRVREFGRTFPTALGSYNPWWNAGTEHFIGVTSGAQNFALLNMPLLKCFAIETFYGPALFFWLMIGFPWIGVASLRAAGARWAGALAGGIMMCAATRAMFLFFWQSGNVGSMVSAMLALPVVALGWRLVVLRRGGLWTALALALAAWLVCIWSPGAFVCVGVALGWLVNPRQWTRRHCAWLFAGGALALLLLSPWLWTTLGPCRGILAYVGGGAPPESRQQMALAGLRQFGRRLQEWHPLVLFFGLGTALLGFRRAAWRYQAAVVATVACVTLSIAFKRQSQLDRMALHLAMVCILPAAIQLGRLFAPSPEAGARRAPRVLAQGVVLALLLLGLRIAGAHLRNEGGFKLWPSQPSVDAFIEVVRREVPADARLAFAGMTDCKYEWGKPAFFPVLAQREMMATDYYGYPKGLISYNYPPVPYRKTVEGVVSFSQAYGITHWTTADDYWRGVFTRNPEHFQRVHSMPMQSSRVDLFKALDVVNPTRFFEGAGRVEARENRIDVEPADPDAARLVIRYNWRDGLVCHTPGAAIAPFPVDENLVFIAIAPNGNPRVILGYRPNGAPLKANFDGTFHH